MRREQFSLDFRDVAWVEEEGTPVLPTMLVSVDLDESAIESRLRDPRGDWLAASEIDVSVRVQGAADLSDASGVVAVTNRVTGEYGFECNIDVGDFLQFVTAARRYGEQTEDPHRYQLKITTDDTDVASYQKRTLLVYSNDGELLRQHSLIPSGVEI